MPIRNNIEISEEDAVMYDQYIQQAGYYDRLQYVYKIKLNSFYGALTNKYFRFYDLRMGESTTGTGRAILRHQCAKANEVLTGEYDVMGEAIIYGDTDSSYFKTYAKTKKKAIEVADAVAEEVNNSYREFMENSFLCQPGFDGVIKAGREIVSDRGIFVEKKRYILHVVDSEGTSVDKVKTMGLELKKTTLPKAISKELTKFIEKLLKGASWETVCDEIVTYRKQLKQGDITLLGLPKGVKKVEDYTKKYEEAAKTGDVKAARLPGHVAASILWNKRLEQYDDKISPLITTGMKIRVYYLTQIIDDHFKSIALPVDLEIIPDWFLKEFNPIIDAEAQVERLVDAPLEHILNAIGKHVPSEKEIQLNDLFTF